jgi:hypothetical protein
MTKEKLSAVHRMFSRVAHETGCKLVTNKSHRTQSYTFELVPDGCSYGPMLRVNERTNFDSLLATGTEEMTELVNQRKFHQADFSD